MLPLIFDKKLLPKKRNPLSEWVSKVKVIPLGLEPRTPTLKV
jgi:hypothetical protein